VPADLVRLSCGVEDPADLVEDLAQAIGVTAGAASSA
jgi:cystathionine beta-lyase/cystathionine gamma-synthase